MTRPDWTGDIPADLSAAVELGGEMGQRFAEYDWDSHPLGPLSGWSAELRTAVAVALTSRFPILLWLGERDLFVVYNDGYAPMLGERHPGSLGVPGKEVWWEIWNSIGPMLRGVIDTGRATWSADLLLPLVTGGRPTERYFTFSYSPMIFADGHIGGVFCAVTETTERVLGERRLYTLHRLGSALMEITTVDEAVRATIEVCEGQTADLPFVGVYVADPETGEQLLRGTSAVVGDVLPPTLRDLREYVGEIGPVATVIDDVGAHLTGLADAFPEGCPERAMLIELAEGRRGSGGHLLLGLNSRRPLDEQYEGFCRLFADQVARAFASARSQEFERQRADALAELDRAKTAFLANVSHEFRTPLTLLLGPLEDAMTALRETGDEEQVTRLQTAERNARRLLRLVNSLLDFSRAESGAATPKLVATDIGALTAQIASSFTELCDRAGLRLVLDCEPAVAQVDPEMWETVVLNLLSNAVKFTLAGSITVRVEPDGAGRVRVAVSDTGIGIPAADLARLFDRFYRATNSRGRSVEGSGIGLSLVRSLVDSQGGTVAVASEVDLGTTVTIDLPAVTAPPAATSPGPPRSDHNAYVTEAMQWLEPDSGERAPTGKRRVVLVADDNADMRRHLQRILSVRWDTITAEDGDSALAAVREQRPDLVITDVMMPGTDGLDFVAKLRGDPEVSSLPVIMLSARAGVEAAGEGLAGGADDYLVKPFRSADLVNRVAARLEIAAREQLARERDEVERRRSSALAELRASLGDATTVDEAITALLAAPSICGDAAAAGLGVIDPDRHQLAVHYGGTITGELRDRYHVVALDAPIPIADVARTGSTLVIPDTLASDERYNAVVHDVRDSVRAVVVEPLRDGTGAVFGALALLWPWAREFSPEEVALIGRAAAMTASAVTRIRTAEREHRIAADFQEHLLDLDVRSTAAAVAGTYQPAGETMRVGGDWYLTIGLDSAHRIGVSVGDVVGHGLPAATVMSRLRSALAAAALVTSEPKTVLDLVDRYAGTVPGARCATVAYAVLDSEAQTISYACAGHPYPLVITPDGRPHYLESGQRPPLAARVAAAGGPGGTSDLPTGSLVVLYTDGLIERPGESLDDGLDRLARAAAAYRDLPVDAVCTALLAALSPPGGYTDDVALLAIRPSGVTATSFVDAIPPTSAAIPPLRQRLRSWLKQTEAGTDARHDILLTVGEALTNAVEHGRSGDAMQAIAIEVFVTGDNITASVTDRGRWESDSSASRRAAQRGRGLSLIYGLSDSVDIVRSNRGTRVTVRHRRSTGRRSR